MSGNFFDRINWIYMIFLFILTILSILSKKWDFLYYELRGLRPDWSIGVMEYWSDVFRREIILPHGFPLLQYSTSPHQWHEIKRAIISVSCRNSDIFFKRK